MTDEGDIQGPFAAQYLYNKAKKKKVKCAPATATAPAEGHSASAADAAAAEVVRLTPAYTEEAPLTIEVEHGAALHDPALGTPIQEDTPDAGTLVADLVAGQVDDPTGTRGIAVASGADQILGELVLLFEVGGRQRGRERVRRRRIA